MDWLPRTKWPFKKNSVHFHGLWIPPASASLLASPYPTVPSCVLAYLSSKAVELKLCACLYRFFLSFTEQSIVCTNYLPGNPGSEPVLFHCSVCCVIVKVRVCAAKDICLSDLLLLLVPHVLQNLLAIKTWRKKGESRSLLPSWTRNPRRLYSTNQLHLCSERLSQWFWPNFFGFRV